MSIPKPKFVSCDETSLKISVDYAPPVGTSMTMQYKEPYEAWPAAREIPFPSSSGVISLSVSELVDLKPGSAYFVRVACRNQSTGDVEYGIEAVFDTKPIDCTPKRKKCTIS